MLLDAGKITLRNSVTMLCAFFSFYRYREGYKFREVIGQRLLSLITVKRKLVIEVSLLYCSLQTHSLFFFCCCAVWYSWTKRMSNTTKLFMYIIRTYCATYCYIMTRSLFFLSEISWRITLSRSQTKFVNLRENAVMDSWFSSILLTPYRHFFYLKSCPLATLW